MEMIQLKLFERRIDLTTRTCQKLHRRWSFVKPFPFPRQAVTRLCRQDPSRSIDSEIIAPRGAWEHVTAAALVAMSWTNVRMFHKALTMAQVMIEARPEGSCDSALDEFWRVQGGPLDETIYELLFPGLLNEKTALGTLSLLEVRLWEPCPLDQN